jgi:hypothetical protein
MEKAVVFVFRIDVAVRKRNASNTALEVVLVGGGGMVVFCTVNEEKMKDTINVLVLLLL